MNAVVSKWLLLRVFVIKDSLEAIATKCYSNDSSVRSLLNENSEVHMNQAKKTADFLKNQVDEKGMIDVGAGVEKELGISTEKMNQALHLMELDRYLVYGVVLICNQSW